MHKKGAKGMYTDVIFFILIEDFKFFFYIYYTTDDKAIL